MEQVFNGDSRATFNIDEPVDLDIIDEIWKRDVYRVNAKPGMKILDVGAHKGIFSVLCALRGARVTAYEPHPRTFQKLLAHLDLNQVTHLVEPYNLAVWSESAMLDLHQNPGNPGGSNVHWPNHRCVGACSELPIVAVEAIPFSLALASQEWDFVKLDCEGAEYAFLTNTADEDLSRIKRLAMEVHDWSGLEVYRRMVKKLSRIFHIEGYGKNGKMFYYLYATRR